MMQCGSLSRAKWCSQKGRRLEALREGPPRWEVGRAHIHNKIL